MISDFFADQELNFEQVKSLSSAMLSVAKVDGIHDREMALIRDFYESCKRSGDPSLEEVAGKGFDIGGAKKLFATPEISKLFVKSLILLAFADGKYGHAEDALIREYGNALGVGGEDVTRLHQATKEYLLGSLAHIQNNEALLEVARRLDLS